MVTNVEQVVGDDVLLKTLRRYGPRAKASVRGDDLRFCFGANLWQGHMGSSSKCCGIFKLD